ncbi:hypothetical protein EON66_05425 [archaeon]|nr:MAG: hypothetical protein EON66_05425 [archaeon]
MAGVVEGDAAGCGVRAFTAAARARASVCVWEGAEKGWRVPELCRAGQQLPHAGRTPANARGAARAQQQQQQRQRGNNCTPSYLTCCTPDAPPDARATRRLRTAPPAHRAACAPHRFGLLLHVREQHSCVCSRACWLLGSVGTCGVAFQPRPSSRCQHASSTAP